jgi:hypothetical protein
MHKFSMSIQSNRSARTTYRSLACWFLLLAVTLSAQAQVLWYAKIPSGSHLTEILALSCSVSLHQKTPKINPACRK